METSMRLYGPPLSNNVFRPLLVARHLGLKVEVAPVDMVRGEHKGEAFRRLNPHGRIPALVDGDFMLFESLAIVQYFAGLKASEIYPDNYRTRAQILAWQAWGVAHLSRGVAPIQFNRLFKRVFNMGEPDEVAIAAAMTVMETEGRALEEQLDRNGGWLVGEALSVADYDVGGWFLHAEAAGIPMGASTAAWVAKLRALPAWEAAKA